MVNMAAATQWRQQIKLVSGALKEGETGSWLKANAAPATVTVRVL